MTRDKKFYDLMRTLNEQASVQIPLTEVPAVAVRRIFKDGESVKALSKFHTRYDESHGRIYPMFDDDEGYDDIQDSNIPTDEVVEGVAYAWETLMAATTFTALTHAYNELCQAISMLITWHPSYDAEWSELRKD